MHTSQSDMPIKLKVFDVFYSPHLALQYKCIASLRQNCASASGLLQSSLSYHIAGLVVNYGISNTIVLEMP